MPQGLPRKVRIAFLLQVVTVSLAVLACGWLISVVIKHGYVQNASQAEAASSGDAVRTTQLALPREVCEVVYATPGYERSVSNLAGVDLDSDTVFGDGHDLQVPTVTGGAAAGYTATLAVPV